MIISAREAIRAVPNSIRLGAYALGATRWQTFRRVLLPVGIDIAVRDRTAVGGEMAAHRRQPFDQGGLAPPRHNVVGPPLQDVNGGCDGQGYHVDDDGVSRDCELCNGTGSITVNVAP